jgi:hypothetical protein
MRKYIQNKNYSYLRNERYMVNKSEMARRLNCDPYTIHRYLKSDPGEIIPQKSKGIYGSVLDDYKAIIIDKVDTYWDTAMVAFKFI